MIRTSITPVSTKVFVSIPKEYIGKKVEILLFSEEEAEDKHPVKKNTMAKYKGILSAETALEMQNYVKQSREEWERNI
jgi:hypothetical protein